MFNFTKIIWLATCPICVGQCISCGPDECPFVEDVSQANPKITCASWINSVQEHLNCFLVVLVDYGCQAPSKVFAVLGI